MIQKFRRHLLVRDSGKNISEKKRADVRRCASPAQWNIFRRLNENSIPFVMNEDLNIKNGRVADFMTTKKSGYGQIAIEIDCKDPDEAKKFHSGNGVKFIPISYQYAMYMSNKGFLELLESVKHDTVGPILPVVFKNGKVRRKGVKMQMDLDAYYSDPWKNEDTSGDPPW